MDLREKRILITGGKGFLGTAVCDYLVTQGIKIVDLDTENDVSKTGAAYIFSSSAIDLVSQEQTNYIFKKVRPHAVIHLAAKVGGIGANAKHPGTYYYSNLLIGTNVVEACRLFKTEKITIIGTICSYPKFTPSPFKEIDLWNGYPEETNAPYGIAKKALLVQAESYKKEFGFKYAYLMPANLYGPKDNFDLERSHVIPAIIRKCVEAKKYKRPTLECWGTGSATREFLYVKDAAEAIVKATQYYDGSEPVNLGNGAEISIKELVTKIAAMIRYHGEIVWDASKPDGQPKRVLDTSKANAKFGFTARTSLDEGLSDTIKWYESEYRDR